MEDTDSDSADSRDPIDTTVTDSDAIPHFYTPDPSEVEQFLQSVIGALPREPSPDVGHARSGTPPLALETHNHCLDQVSFSPPQCSPSSSSSVDFAFDHQPSTDTTMPPPSVSASTIEACRKHLVPVLAASAQARDAEKGLDSDQCLALLTDDRCKTLIHRAKETRRQLSSLASQKTPMDRRGSKRDRTDEVDDWIRSSQSERNASARNRFDSTSTLVPDSVASRRDSDATLVDSPGGGSGGGGGGKRLPPKAPRAMLQKKHAAQAVQEAPYVSSPPTQDPPVGLVDIVHQAIQMIPALVTASQPEEAQAPSANFVSHLSTQPGIWFKQQGRRFAEIVDVEIQVSDEVFYTSKDSRPFRLRTHLRLCSVPVSAANGEPTATETHVQDETDIEHHTQHWPTKGHLVVQVNPESERSKTYLPHTLEIDPLDVTSCVRPGKNTFRFIQLSDLSEFTFVLVASPPPPEEAWRSWDWESFVERSRAREDSNMDTNGLSEFARVPVFVRS